MRSSERLLFTDCLSIYLSICIVLTRCCVLTLVTRGLIQVIYVFTWAVLGPRAAGSPQLDEVLRQGFLQA